MKRNPVKKLWLLSIALIFIVSAALTACGGSKDAAKTSAAPTADAAKTAAPAAKDTPAPSAAAEDITLTYSSGFTGPDRPAYEELAKKFTEQHPNIKINMDIQPWDVLLAKLPASLSTGQGPDIASFDTALIPQYAKAKLILPLDELYANGMDQKVMAPSLVEAMKYKGQLFSVPANTATLLMYYNKDIFKAAGIAAPPTTWAEWQDDILKTTKTTGTDKQYGLVLADHATIPMWPILVWGNGGDIASADNSKSMLNDPKTIEAFKIWGDLVANKGISPVGLTGAQADTIFGAGKAAMEINGPWMAGGLKLNYGVAPVPAGPAGKFTLANAAAMVAGKNTKHKDAVYEFMKFWNSAESQAFLSSKSGFPPTRTDLGDNAEVKSNPLIPQFAAVAKDAKFYLPGLESFAKIDGDIITPAIQAITNKQDAAKVLADAGKKLDTILQAK